MRRAAWIVQLGVGAALVLAQAAAPDGAARDGLYAATALLALAGLVVGVRLHRPARRRAWWLLLAGIALWVLGDLVWGLLTPGLGPHVTPTPMDAVYLAAYPLLAAGLWFLTSGRSRVRDALAVLDALIVTAAVAAVLWVLVVQPSWTMPDGSLGGRVVGVLYPLADALLLAYLVHLVLATHRRSASLLLLTAGSTAVLVGDVALQLVRVQPDLVASTRPLETAWLVTYLLWSAAALHPGMTTVGAARPRGAVGPGSGLRVLYLAAAALLLPGVLLVESALGLPVNGMVVGLFSVVVIGLLAIRLVLMIRRMQEQATHLRRMADTDFLTGLLNRHRFVHHLSGVTGRLRRGEEEGSAAVLVIGLTRFTEINDTLGHRIGDELLRAVAGRLSEHRCGGAVLARLGGDVFGVLLPDAGADQALGCALQVTGLLRRPFEVSDLGVDVQAGVGFVVIPDDGVDPAVLLHRADVAMSVARDRSDHVARYDPTMEVGGAVAPQLMAELGEALEAGQLLLHYQPQISLCTGEVVGAEALVRWQHPVHGLLAPVAFVPAAERTGQIRPLTRYVLDAAVAECARWQADGPRTVAVNLSVRSLLDPRLVDDVREALERHGLEPSRLELEITETSAMVDPERSRRALCALQEVGVVLSIDDYGTGYGSLAYLRELPVSRLKIDRTFVAGLRDSDASAAIVRSVIELSRRLGLSVVAEGVEDDETLLALRDMHCDFAQGYGIARPVPADRLAGVAEEIRSRLPARLGEPAAATGEVPRPRGAPDDGAARPAASPSPAGRPAPPNGGPDLPPTAP